MSKVDGDARLGLAIENPHARFRCVFPHACEGICCRQGRPNPLPQENQRIQASLKQFLPHLRAPARAHVEQNGYLTRRTKNGRPMMAVVGGWCVFFNRGCVLHKIGAEQGDKFKYKPKVCVLFPLEEGEAPGTWYFRQRGVRGESWDLFCLNPEETRVKAVDSMQDEIRFAREELPRRLRGYQYPQR
ncbi:MAG: DUF3109 family protein [Planctomycetota bacterium]